MNKFEITPNTIVGDLLKQYPELEDTLIEIAPVFKKLKNPILKRTIAKVTSLRQAAIIGKIPLSEMINKLRKSAGQEEINLTSEPGGEQRPAPDWIKNSVSIQYDAREDLENGIHPMTQVVKETAAMNKDEIYLLITPFIPLPLIDILKEKGFDCYSITEGDNLVKNYFRKY
jgi:hypothetical protein